MTARKPRPRYIDQLELCVGFDDAATKRILRRLVREAVLRTVPSNEPTEADRIYANRIAKEIIP